MSGMNTTTDLFAIGVKSSLSILRHATSPRWTKTCQSMVCPASWKILPLLRRISSKASSVSQKRSSSSETKISTSHFQTSQKRLCQPKAVPRKRSSCRKTPVHIAQLSQRKETSTLHCRISKSKRSLVAAASAKCSWSKRQGQKRSMRWNPSEKM